MSSKPDPSTVQLDRKALCTTVAIFAAVVGLTFIVGLIGDRISNHHADFRKAEGLLEDLSVMAAEIPRLPNGAILRQGPLSTAWLDDSGALPARLQAMPASLRGQPTQHSLGLVRRGPWSDLLSLEAKGSLVWTAVQTVPKAVCLQLANAVIKHPDQIAYITTNGDLPTLPLVAEPLAVCRSDFTNFNIVTLSPNVELRRLADDIERAVAAPSNGLGDKTFISGTSAPFQVSQQREGGPNYIERERSGIRVTIGNVPLSVCRLALLAGPQAFGMDNFESMDGSIMKAPHKLSSAGALCGAQRGRLVMSRL